MRLCEAEIVANKLKTTNSHKVDLNQFQFVVVVVVGKSFIGIVVVNATWR